MRNTLILVLSCFCLSFACSSCHTADEELPRPEAPNPPVYTDGDGMLKFRRIGHFAWYSNHTMSQWVKLRGEFAAYSFVSQQMALYLCIAV